MTHTLHPLADYLYLYPREASAAPAASFLSARLYRVSAALEQARIAVYTVGQSTQGAGAAIATLSKSTLQQLSALTGGRAYASGAIDAAITQARTDARACYTVAYNPSPQIWNGKYHKIRIASDRLGIHFSAKQGYHAIADPAPMLLEQTILGIASSRPLEVSEIGLRATVSTGADSSQPIHIRIRIDPADVLFIPHGDQLTGSLLVAVRYESGRKRRTSRPIRTKRPSRSPLN